MVFCYNILDRLRQHPSETWRLANAVSLFWGKISSQLHPTDMYRVPLCLPDTGAHADFSDQQNRQNPQTHRACHLKSMFGDICLHYEFVLQYF